MLLEDLSPNLFNSLGAAAERLAVAENEEELAQVALSGRRYMEQLADALFPAVDGKRPGRALTSAAYKNRLWAFVEEHNTNGPLRLREIGTEIDRVGVKTITSLCRQRWECQMRCLSTQCEGKDWQLGDEN